MSIASPSIEGGASPHSDATSDHAPLLTVEDLSIVIGATELVRGVDFSIDRGEVLGLVGESGSGKTLTALSIVGLLPDKAMVDGSIRFEGEELIGLEEARLNEFRGRRIGIVFQDAMRALNPMLSIGTQLTEGLRYHLRLSHDEATERAMDWLRAMEIPDPGKRIRDDPHQLSGGMRQRVMAAVSLACEPDLLIADEPTTAVDVTAQAEILQLLREQIERLNSAMLFITHDFGALAGIGDRVAVMYAGRIVETGDAEALFARPSHPYTRGLLKTVPRMETIDSRREFESIVGAPPTPGMLPNGCSFSPRCPLVTARCQSEDPVPREVAPNRLTACHRAEEVLAEASR